MSLQCAGQWVKGLGCRMMGGGPLNEQTGGGGVESCYKAPDLLCLK